MMKNELKEKILSKFGTYKKCAEAMDMDVGRFFILLRGTYKWERAEIAKICKLLGITQERISEYFEPSDIKFVKYYMVREKILERFGSVSNYCKISGHSVCNLYGKLSGQYSWTWRDVVQFCEIFSIPIANAKFYFGGNFTTGVFDIECVIRQHYGTIKCACDELGCQYSVLWKFLNEGGLVDEVVACELCDALGLNIKQLRKTQDITPVIYEMGIINKGDFKRIQEYIGLSYSGLWRRLHKQKQWEPEELMKLEEFLGIGDLGDYIDKNGYTEMIVVNKYALGNIERRMIS